MEILVAKSGGFCHGVKKAVDTALSIDSENTYIYGEIIHNKEVVDTITARGIVTVESLSDVPDGATLVIRSHGAAKRVFDECEARGVKVVDCTCEFVRRTQKIVDEQHRRGNSVVIVGERTHPEVIGLNGWCEDSAYIFSSEEDDFSVLPDLSKKISQTRLPTRQSPDTIIKGIITAFGKVSSPNFESRIINALLRKCASTVGRILPARNATKAYAAPQRN